MHPLLLFATIICLLAASACGGGKDGPHPTNKAGILPPEQTIPPLTATPAAGATVIPNGGWVHGPNSAVVQGGGSAQGVAARAQADSKRPVLAIWFLAEGSWRYSVPSLPEIDGGLKDLRPTVSAVVIVLD